MTTRTSPITEHIFSARELRNRGYSASTIRRLVLRKRLLTIYHGVYVRQSIWNSWSREEKEIARCVGYSKVAKDPIFTHLSAAHLYGLPTLSKSDFLHVAQTSLCKKAPPGIRLHRYSFDIQKHSAATAHGVLATSPLQTVVDCSRVYGSLEGTVIADSALKTMVNFAELQAALTTVKGYGSARAKEVAERMSPHSESVGESITRYRLHEFGFPAPEEQVSIRTPYGLFRPDFIWRDLRVILEFDGRGKYQDYGDTQQALIRERDREKALANQGWIIVRVNWESVYLYPERLTRDLKRAFVRARKL